VNFSIIIPTFNSEAFIDDCMIAIRNLNYSSDNYEVIVVDGGSKDEILKILNKYNCVKVLFSKNISISNSRNLGAQNALGDNLVFIDSDCLVAPNLLKNAEKHLSKFECCGSFYKSHENHGWIATTWLIVEQKKDGIVNWITSGTLAVKNSQFFKINGFNESLETEEDEDFGLRVRQSGGKLFNDSSMASIHIGQADTICNFFKKEMWRGKCLIKTDSKGKINKITLFDLVIFSYFFNLCFVLISFVFHFKLLLSSFIIFMFMIPLAFTIRKVLQVPKTDLFIKIYFLYFLFFLARSLSLLRYNQFKRIFTKQKSVIAA